METLTSHRRLDGRNKTITTFVVHEASQLLDTMAEGEILEIVVRKARKIIFHMHSMAVRNQKGQAAQSETTDFD